MALPEVESRDQWLAARVVLPAKEKDLTRRPDALNMRRHLRSSAHRQLSASAAWSVHRTVSLRVPCVTHELLSRARARPLPNPALLLAAWPPAS
jgi:hypothetical protein